MNGCDSKQWLTFKPIVHIVNTVEVQKCTNKLVASKIKEKIYMKFIDEVNIKNYKGFSEMSLSCNSINIIVGPNNTGKSSILESIWMGLSSLNNYKDSIDNQFTEIIGNEDYRYLVHNNEEKIRPEISLILSTQENRKIYLDYSESGLPNGENEKYIFMDYDDSVSYSRASPIRYRAPSEARRSPYRKLTETLSEFIEIKERDNRELPENDFNKLLNLLTEISSDMENEIQFLKQRLLDSEKMFVYPEIYSENSSFKLMERSFYVIDDKGERDSIIPFLINKSSRPDGALYNKAFESKKVIDVIEYLKKRIHYFEDIREKDGRLYVFLKDIDEPLPLSSMGDGFNSLLINSFITTLIEKGVVLFEEPEISMHPGYLGVFAKEIVDNSKNHQIFLSTHSMELIKYILDSAEKSNILDEINIVKLSRFSNGFIEREIINGTYAKEEIEEINTDLRGF
ncbi:AAA family ATPase [Methanolobus bombayensis]|uniref:AAA family ATPase n=1 Tax=Methanolobus bombayensis TaxID=38023 RepID=UPI001AE44D39|nr:ATP-binding protein [Methanolobus bombayensis]MBP1909797.1 AAA15 family ATPase/GTPase [Methanolobus bombayensis]